MASITVNRATLLGLPAELRDIIWRYTVTESYPLVLFTHKRLDLGPEGYYEYEVDHKSPPRLPDIARVNHQIRQETLAVYYSANTFVFRLRPGRSEKIYHWAKACNHPEAMASLNHIVFEIQLRDFDKDASEGSHRSEDARIHLKAKGRHDAAFEGRGVLAKECICWIGGISDFQFNFYEEGMPIFGNSASCFVLFLAEALEDKLIMLQREGSGHTRTYHCDRCGKRVFFYPILPDSDFGWPGDIVDGRMVYL